MDTKNKRIISHAGGIQPEPLKVLSQQSNTTPRHHKKAQQPEYTFTTAAVYPLQEHKSSIPPS